MQADQATGDELTPIELDQAEALDPDQVGELDPVPEIAAEALDQAGAVDQVEAQETQPRGPTVETDD